MEKCRKINLMCVTNKSNYYANFDHWAIKSNHELTELLNNKRKLLSFLALIKTSLDRN